MFFSKNNNKLCKNGFAIKKLQFETFLGLHDSFDDPFRRGFLAG